MAVCWRVPRWRAGGTAAALLFALPFAAVGGSNADAASQSRSLADQVVLAYQRQLLDPEAIDLGDTQPSMFKTANETATGTGVQLPPSVGGSWERLSPFPTEFNAIHAITGPNGKILLVAGSGKNKAAFKAGTFTSYIWDPATGERRMISTPDDLFCAGHVLLPDGRALVGGGTTGYSPFKGAKALYAFNFYTEAYERLSPLEVARWYPATVTGADGRVLFIAGLDDTGIDTKTTESFDPRSNTHTVVPSQRALPVYARVHLAWNGKFYIAERSGTG